MELNNYDLVLGVGNSTTEYIYSNASIIVANIRAFRYLHRIVGLINSMAKSNAVTIYSNSSITNRASIICYMLSNTICIYVIARDQYHKYSLIMNSKCLITVHILPTYTGLVALKGLQCYNNRHRSDLIALSRIYRKSFTIMERESIITARRVPLGCEYPPIYEYHYNN
jgi:hypothetical protein